MNYRYYINGKRVTAEDVKKQQEINAQILSIRDPDEFLDALKDAGFIAIFNEKGEPVC